MSDNPQPTVGSDIPLSNVILSNLQSIERKQTIEQILVLTTLTAHPHDSLYRDAVIQYDMSGAFPSPQYFALKYQAVFEISTETFTHDILAGFMSSLRLQSAQNKASQMLSQGRLDKAREVLNGIKSYAPMEPTTDFDNILEAYEFLLSRPSGIKLGIPEIDNIMNGAPFGTMGIIAAPPSRGKSTSLKSIAYNVAVKLKFNTLIISIEDAVRNVLFDLISRHANDIGYKIDSGLVKKALLTKDDYGLFKLAQQDFIEKGYKSRLHIIGVESITSFDFSTLDALFEAQDKKFMAETGVGLEVFGFDYIQETAGYRPMGTEPMQFMNDLVRYFASKCKAFKSIDTEKPRGLIGIVLSQINREGEARIARKGKADMGCLAELNALERSADWILCQYANEQERLSNSLRLQLLKQRGGLIMADMVSTFFDPKAVMVGASEYGEIFTPNSISVSDEAIEVDGSMFELT